MSNYIHPLQQHKSFVTKKKINTVQNDNQFKQILAEKQDLKVSKHARARLIERNIHIDDEKWQQISDKMNEAKLKGVTDSVVVTKDATLIVSNKNNTVVTALNHDEAQSKVFTNINGMILLNN